MKSEFTTIHSIGELHDFIKENLLTKVEASKITGQSIGAFNQSVKMGMIKPFFESEGSTSSKVRLYLKSDMEAYRDRKQK